MIACPRCNSSEKVYLTTPDHGFGFGTEFACSNEDCSREGRFLFVSHDAEALETSDASRAQSAENAEAYRHQQYLDMLIDKAKR